MPIIKHANLIRAGDGDHQLFMMMGPDFNRT